MRLPALPPGAEPDVVRETRPSAPAETDRGLTNPAVDLDEDTTAPYEGPENDVNMAIQQNGEPIHMTLEEVKRSMVKDDLKLASPVTISEDETETREYVNVNIADRKEKTSPAVGDADMNIPDSEYYNVNRYDKMRQGKNKNKETNADLEYAEVNVDDNVENGQNEAAKASGARSNTGLEYAAIDKDKTKRKKNFDSSQSNEKL